MFIPVYHLWLFLKTPAVLSSSSLSSLVHHWREQERKLQSLKTITFYVFLLEIVKNRKTKLPGRWHFGGHECNYLYEISSQIHIRLEVRTSQMKLRLSWWNCNKIVNEWSFLTVSSTADMVYKHTSDVYVNVKTLTRVSSALTLSKSLNNSRLLVFRGRKETKQMNKTENKGFLDLTVHTILIRWRSSYSIFMLVEFYRHAALRCLVTDVNNLQPSSEHLASGPPHSMSGRFSLAHNPVNHLNLETSSGLNPILFPLFDRTWQSLQYYFTKIIFNIKTKTYVN